MVRAISRPAVALLFCLTAGTAFAQAVDQLPMYGGMDRSADPALRTADERFIGEVTEKFGSREKASNAWVEQGFRFYQRDDLASAMRRFNQAWLLNPNNPGVFHGYSSVLYDKGDNCGAMRMAERALGLGLATPEFSADTALLYSLCSADTARTADLDKNMLSRKAYDLFARAAERAPNNAYVFDKWWQALFWRGEYADAWKKVFAMRAAGGRPHEPFLRELRRKMPEPTQ
jgi:tetratricopeptide (TPR) repeat protein